MYDVLELFLVGQTKENILAWERVADYYTFLRANSSVIPDVKV